MIRGIPFQAQLATRSRSRRCPVEQLDLDRQSLGREHRCERVDAARCGLERVSHTSTRSRSGMDFRLVAGSVLRTRPRTDESGPHRATSTATTPTSSTARGQAVPPAAFMARIQRAGAPPRAPGYLGAGDYVTPTTGTLTSARPTSPGSRSRAGRATSCSWPRTRSSATSSTTPSRSFRCTRRGTCGVTYPDENNVVLLGRPACEWRTAARQ